MCSDSRAAADPSSICFLMILKIAVSGFRENLHVKWQFKEHIHCVFLRLPSGCTFLFSYFGWLNMHNSIKSTNFLLTFRTHVWDKIKDSLVRKTSLVYFLSLCGWYILLNATSSNFVSKGLQCFGLWQNTHKTNPTFIIFSWTLYLVLVSKC